MIASQTLTISEVATQLPHWIKQVKRAAHPLWLTTKKDEAPVVVVVEADEYKQLQKRQNLLYEWQLLNLTQWLDRVEKCWDSDFLKEECVRVWQENILKLWEVAPKSVRVFVAGLTLSAQKIDAQTLSMEQVSALQFSLAIIRDAALDETGQEKAYQKLMESGISPKPSFEEDLIQLYLDEL